MPIFQLHMKSVEMLNSRIKIENLNAFTTGAIFPDALWDYQVDPNNTSCLICRDPEEKTIKRLHTSKYMGTLRLPNYIEFYRKNAYMLSMSDFMRGIMFHYMLDCLHNLKWSEYTTTNSDIYSLTTCYGKVIKGLSLSELLNYKYSSMLAYVIKKPTNLKVPTEVDRSVIPIADEKYRITEQQILDSFETIRTAIEEQSKLTDIPAVLSEDFFDSVLNDTIEEYCRFAYLSNWV